MFLPSPWVLSFSYQFSTAVTLTIECKPYKEKHGIFFKLMLGHITLKLFVIVSLAIISWICFVIFYRKYSILYKI
jgi:hypothetical protein